MEKFNSMKIWYLLTPHERKRAILLLIMILIMALLDTIGVASILPFIAVLSNPELVQSNMIINTIFKSSRIFGVETIQQFLFALGILVFFLLVFSLSFKALTIYAQERFVKMREFSIGKRLVEGYLYQSYSWFLSRHSADLGKNILSEVGEVIVKAINPLITLIANGMIAVGILTLLIIANPSLAIIVGCTLSLAYGLIYTFARHHLHRIGEERLNSNAMRYTKISEAFGAAKDVKVKGLENNYISLFSDPARVYAKTNTSISIFEKLPRYALEAIAFGGMILVLLYMMTLTGSFNSALPIISLYAFAGYRLMPALQAIYQSLALIRFSGPSVETLSKDLDNIKYIKNYNDDKVMTLNKSINLKNIHYNYPNSPLTALKGINLNIPVNSNIGLVGKTGSGKTTSVDIILGLLEAQIGTLEVDGQIINNQNVRSWQKSIGYVPQNIYLSDDTVAANIALGIDPKEFNQQAIEKACKIANIHDFVIGELKDKYQTTIGERGVRLSGGQRQRIGIARALYHNPKVLILDEATSSLDNQTEQAVMDAVNKLNKNITIIMIAHRLTTVKKCDKIYFFEKGQITGQGDFDYLKQNNKLFNLMSEVV